MNSDNKKIFIGGTGRSGTTILSQWLGSHSKIERLPFETRFIIDKYGLIDLYRSLTTDYSFEQSRLALKNFQRMMYNQMTCPFYPPYLGMEFKKTFGKENYIKQLDSFFSQLHYGKFLASDYHSLDKSVLRSQTRMLGIIFYKMINKSLVHTLHILKRGHPVYNGKNWPKEKMFIGKYFKDEQELSDLIAYFVNSLFCNYASKKQKIHWCEDTPANMMHVDFLSKIFEDAYFIHIVRNPIGVAFSYKNQFWAPKDYNQIIPMLSGMYEKLITMKEFALRNKVNYLEIKLENLTKTNSQFAILDFLHVDDIFTKKIRLKEEKVNYYTNLIPNKDSGLLKDGLKKYIKYFDYD